MDFRIIKNISGIDMVRWKVPYSFVKHVYSIYVEMVWNFLVVIYTQNISSRKILDFSDD